MPLRLDIKRRLTARSDRVKSVDLHPTEPWMVVSLYSGAVVVWNHDTQTMVKTFELCELPVRVARFVARKHWVIAGSDDMQIRVFNYNTLERVHMFEAHADYIRCIAVHPTQPYILTSSDDMLIKLWDWDRKWACTQVFEGHTHYVMQIVINPKDNNQFASASLDRTIKVWQLGSRTANFTLEGHEKGVNCIDYYSGGDKPYLISGADDCHVKIWDYQNKTCVQTLEGHAQNVTCVSFHPGLPIILTGAEDGTVRVWHSNTYRLENTLNYGMERVWCISGQRGSNSVAVGYDEGSIIIKLGREEPAMSMDSSGKIMWARHSEVQQANLKAMGDTEVRDGERLSLGCKDMGSCEIYPQTIQHSPNGRFVVVCGDGEYIIYTAMALRNKSFGSALEFVWAHDSSQYATREGNSMLKIFKNFKEKKSFKPDFGAEGIFGGFLLGVRSSTGLAFFDWECAELVRRIEIQPKHIFWSDSGELVCIATDESFFVLRYLPDKVSAALESKESVTEDGIEDAFEVLGEISEVVKTGLWVGDCFMYTSSVNRLNYYVGGEIITIAHMDRTMYLLGYIPKDDRLYLGDKELNVVSYALLLSMLEYQTAVMRRDFGTADKILPTIPREQRTRVANFLEKQGFKQQALAVSTDPEHKFELALHLGELDTAYQLAVEAESEQKWKQLAELATTKCQFSLAQECLDHAQDYGGLLLLATASGNTAMVGKLAEGAEKNGKTNVAFLTYFLQGQLDKCLELLIKTDRLPEAAFLARTYLPSHVPRVVRLWKESLSKVNQKAADALADPTEYGNLFPGLQQALLAEQYLKETHVRVRPAAEYPLIMPNEDRDVLQECAGFVSKEEVGKSEDVEQSMEESSVVAAAVAPVLEAAEETAPPEAAAEETAPLEAAAEATAPPEAAAEETAPPEAAAEETAPPEEEAEENVPLEARADETEPLEEEADETEPLEEEADETEPLEEEADETEPLEEEADETEPLEEEADETEHPEAAADEIVPEVAAAEETAPPEAAAEEAVPPEKAAEEAVEEPIPLQQEVMDPVQTTEEETAQCAASPPPVSVVQEPDDAQPVESASVEVVASTPEVAEVMEASVPAEDDILKESSMDTAPQHPELVQSTPVEDSSVEELVQEASPVALDDPETSLKSAVEVAAATEEAQSDRAATEDVPVTTAFTNDDLRSTESVAAEERPANVELEKDVIPVSASPIKDTAMAFLDEETPVPEDNVLKKAPAAVTVEELISFETTETSSLGETMQVKAPSEIVFDPLFDPLSDTMSLLKPEAAREAGKEEQSTKQPEGNLELLVSLETESAVSSTATDVATKRPSADKPAEEVTLNMDDEDLDDLDLDNFDLEDIDTTDVNLDDELMSE